MGKHNSHLSTAMTQVPLPWLKKYPWCDPASAHWEVPPSLFCWNEWQRADLPWELCSLSNSLPAWDISRGLGLFWGRKELQASGYLVLGDSMYMLLWPKSSSRAVFFKLILHLLIFVLPSPLSLFLILAPLKWSATIGFSGIAKPLIIFWLLNQLPYLDKKSYWDTVGRSEGYNIITC